MPITWWTRILRVLLFMLVLAVPLLLLDWPWPLAYVALLGLLGGTVFGLLRAQRRLERRVSGALNEFVRVGIRVDPEVVARVRRECERLD